MFVSGLYYITIILYIEYMLYYIMYSSGQSDAFHISGPAHTQPVECAAVFGTLYLERHEQGGVLVSKWPSGRLKWSSISLAPELRMSPRSLWEKESVQMKPKSVRMYLWLETFICRAILSGYYTILSSWRCNLWCKIIDMFFSPTWITLILVKWQVTDLELSQISVYWAGLWDIPAVSKPKKWEQTFAAWRNGDFLKFASINCCSPNETHPSSCLIFWAFREQTKNGD